MCLSCDRFSGPWTRSTTLRPVFHVLTLTYLQPLDVIDETRPDHLDWLAREVESGRILLAGRVEAQTGAVLVTGDLSAEEADALAAADPYSKAGVVSYARTSFNGAFRAPGL
ncbi:GTP cyclohydrolase II [Mycolicibacterium monacense DSM 44395]|uniref:YCII-related protein n=3 Tax=unclassified Mycobacterium TaxID=2642494 RepID=A0A5Q5BI76_MYCSS|nr:GTP cyclohydrolase II [Mycolicibacterium monacense DSM 44395]QHP85554.1 GTP cyclohydrolase [Mycolicibacterium monacense DSM 44395]